MEDSDSGGLSGALTRRFVVAALATGFLTALLASCTDTEVIFRDRPLFEDPPEGAGSFVGYFDADRKETTCGNCHVSRETRWRGTAHADAWETLMASGAAQPFCETCHTVSARGNPATGEVGWDATGDRRYHDVQCESCHGPGETHVATPDAVSPLANLSVGADLDIGCAQCHSGVHHPFADEWAQSGHANVVAFAAARVECASCHRGQAVLTAWGVDAEYVERDDPEHLAITCGVCHDPHDARNPKQLRFPVGSVSLEENLCARCHNRGGTPDPASVRGLEPHAPQGPLLVGQAGWFPPNADIDPGRIFGTHGSEANERLCATCHLPSFEVVDQETGDFVFDVSGHLFEAMPCVDEDGVPTREDCALEVGIRSFQGCTGAGCHGTDQVVVNVLTTVENRIGSLAEDLRSQLDEVEATDPDEIDPGNPPFTVAEGALFNYNLATFGGSVRSASVHNPFLVEALLVASIRAMEEEYGVSPSAMIDYDRRLDAILQRARHPGY